MKYLTILLFTVLFTCDSVQENLNENKIMSSNNWCPDDGKCSVTKYENTNLFLKTDEFGNNYTDTTEGENIVLKFEYKRLNTIDAEDSDYTELIWIELKNLEDSFSVSNEDLKNYIVVFTRLCFCRGQTGNYPIKNGKLEYKKEEDSRYLKLTFNNQTVPQVLKFVETYL